MIKRKSGKNRNRKTIAQNSGITTDVDFDLMTGTQSNSRFTEDFKGSGSSLHTLLQGTNVYEDGNIFKDIGAVFSQIKESDIIDEECNEMLQEVLEIVWLNKSCPELKLKFGERGLSLALSEDNPNSECESHRDLYEYMMLHCPNLIEIYDNYERLVQQEYCFQNFVNIIGEKREINFLSTEKKIEAIKNINTIFALEKYPDGQVLTAETIVEDEVNKIVTYLLKMKKTVGTYHEGISNDNKNTTHSTQKSTNENKCARGSAKNILEDKKSPCNIDLENDYETHTITVDDFKNTAAAKHVSDTIETNRLMSICPRQNKCEEKVAQKLKFKIKEILNDCNEHDRFVDEKPDLKIWKDILIFLLNGKRANIKSHQFSNASKGLANEEKVGRIVRNTESLSENYFKTGCNGKAIKVMSPQLEDSKETIVEMNEYNIINFKFDTCRNRFISTPDKEFLFSKQEEQPLTFRFRDEDIQVRFSGENIFVSTKNTKFHIYVRKVTPVN